jgi:acyl-coenzyme A synthetase/AMP-(fatty) acid ligase
VASSTPFPRLRIECAQIFCRCVLASDSRETRLPSLARTATPRDPASTRVYPEDIENALRTAGLRDSVVLETKPGRIEAVVLPPTGSDGATPESIRDSVGAGVKAANATLAQHQRVAGFRIWPEDDLPRTHTLKVKRDVVRRWAAVDEPLPVRQGE